MAVKKAGAIVSGRTYLIVNKKSGKALSAESGADNGGVVEQFFLTREANQLWTAEEAEKGTWKLVCKDSGKCLDVINGGEVDGAWVHQWDYVGGETQQWEAGSCQGRLFQDCQRQIRQVPGRGEHERR